MCKLIKKISVIFTLLLLLTAGLASTSIAFSGESLHEAIPLTKKVTLYRYGPDGSVTPITVDLQIDDRKDIDEALLEKCSELVDNDVELQDYISGAEYGENASVWIRIHRISSWGKGLHWKSRLRFRIPLLVVLRFGMFQDVPLRYKIFGISVIPWVQCQYTNDENAETRIETLSTPTNPDTNTTFINGNHNVTACFFFGYTYWRGHQGKWFDDKGLPTGFDGYSYLTVITRKPSDD